MVRSVATATLVAALLSGCVAAGKPEVSLSPEQQKTRDRNTRLLFAKMISEHPVAGVQNWLVGRREYANARVSGPSLESGQKRICAKVFIKTAISSGEVDISADVIDLPTGVRLRMGKHLDEFGSRCSGPYGPFPELQTWSAKSS